jgi:hypothetical protein
MFNPYELIPKTLDPMIRQMIIVLVTIQLLAFVLYIILMVYSFIQRNKNKEVDQTEEKVEDESVIKKDQ